MAHVHLLCELQLESFVGYVCSCLHGSKDDLALSLIPHDVGQDDPLQAMWGHMSQQETVVPLAAKLQFLKLATHLFKAFEVTFKRLKDPGSNPKVANSASCMIMRIPGNRRLSLQIVCCSCKGPY